MDRVLIVFLSNIQTQWHSEEEMKFFQKSFIPALDWKAKNGIGEKKKRKRFRIRSQFTESNIYFCLTSRDCLRTQFVVVLSSLWEVAFRFIGSLEAALWKTMAVAHSRNRCRMKASGKVPEKGLEDLELRHFNFIPLSGNTSFR